MDEHWDGWGYPAGLRGNEIPLIARIIGLAQVVEIFAEQQGPQAAMAVARERTGRWFEPALVQALTSLVDDAEFWAGMFLTGDLEGAVVAAEPVEHAIQYDADGLDRIGARFPGSSTRSRPSRSRTPSAWPT